VENKVNEIVYADREQQVVSKQCFANGVNR
jgi:hypothetical protein